MSDDTQPLTVDQALAEKSTTTNEPSPDYRKAWSDLAKLPLFQAFAAPPKPTHIHGPFVFLLNQNHNALRGCITCGAAWVGLMAGVEDKHSLQLFGGPP